jgi:hypothetical protein
MDSQGAKTPNRVAEKLPAQSRKGRFGQLPRRPGEKILVGKNVLNRRLVHQKAELLIPTQFFYKAICRIFNDIFHRLKDWHSTAGR